MLPSRRRGRDVWAAGMVENGARGGATRMAERLDISVFVDPDFGENA